MKDYVKYLRFISRSLAWTILSIPIALITSGFLVEILNPSRGDRAGVAAFLFIVAYLISGFGFDNTLKETKK